MKLILSSFDFQIDLMFYKRTTSHISIISYC